MKELFRPKESGAYELLIEGDDGYRVYVNGEKVIDYWGEHASAKREYTLKAIAGTDYKIRIEYMQAGAEALLRFDLGIYRHISPEMVVDRVKKRILLFSQVAFRRVWKAKRCIPLTVPDLLAATVLQLNYRKCSVIS